MKMLYNKINCKIGGNITENLKSILKYIPGFRSNTKWKMVIASIYYLICLLMLTSGPGPFLFLGAIPFLVFYAKNAFKQRTKKSILPILAAAIIMFIGIGITPSTPETKQNTTVSTNKEYKKTYKVKKKDKPAISGQLKIHYIDVGQGDSELIQQGNKNMLIDTGTNASTTSLISYLKNQNIKKIDYLILTHPHEDHIGGADAVINEFDIGTVYMPKITTTTKTFKDVVTSMGKKNLKATAPNPGDKFRLGDATCTILGPINSNKEDLNTYSIVLKVVFGNNKFLFTGDAQASNEQDMINKNYDLSSDVLKIGHHGSHTSTSQGFLDKVSPKYAVISCGKNNDYGHPHKETVERLKAKSIPIYRTDECGTIVCTSDGKNIKFSCNSGDYNFGSEGKSTSNTSSNTQAVSNSSSTPSSSNTSSGASSKATAPATVQSDSNSDSQGTTVYVTPKGKKYHLAGCRTIKGSSTPMSLQQAKSEGYTACKVCNPPQ